MIPNLHSVFWALGIIAAGALIGLALRKFRNRRREPLLTPQTITTLRLRVDKLKERADGRKVLPSLLQQAGYFVGKSATALDFEQQVRARLHANLAAMTLVWAETVLDDDGFKADTPHLRTTSKLTMALEYLKRMNLAAAADEFEFVWTDEHAHFDAKRLAVMGKVWILATKGDHQEAAEHEQLLVMLPRVAQMEDVSMEFGVDKD
jgi:hypothetical protein